MSDAALDATSRPSPAARVAAAAGSAALRLAPAQWREAFRTLARLGVVDRRRLVWVGALSVLRGVTEGVGVVLVLPILQYIEAGGDVAALSGESRIWRGIVDAFAILGLPVNLATLCAAVFLIILLRQIVAYLALIEVERLKEGVAYSLRVRSFEALFAGGSAVLGGQQTGRLVNTVSEQASLAGSMMRNVATLFGLLVTIVVYAVVLLALAPGATLVCAALAVLGATLTRRYASAARQLSLRYVGATQTFTHFLTERFELWRGIKLATAEAREGERVAEWSDVLRRQSVKLIAIGARMQLVVGPLAAAFILGGLYVSIEYLAFSLAAITMFIFAFLRILPLMTMYLGLRQSAVRFAASLERVSDLIDRAEAGREVDGGTDALDQISDSVRYEHVSFSYPDVEAAAGAQALEAVSAAFRVGEITAIVGRSGSGKSTMLDMLPRLIAPDAGQITVDGRPIERFSLRALRSAIAYVGQDALLFGGSALENLRYARPEASFAEIEAACRAAGAWDFLAELPDGLDTEIGDRGERLSGGQRQRLMIAQALLADARIIILDEPTSALDFEAERQVGAMIDALRAARDRVVIVVTHRPTTIRSADQVIVLKDGRVVESGDYSALAQGGGWFEQMLAASRPEHAVSPNDGAAAAEEAGDGRD